MKQEVLGYNLNIGLVIENRCVMSLAATAPVLMVDVKGKNFVAGKFNGQRSQVPRRVR